MLKAKKLNEKRQKLEKEREDKLYKKYKAFEDVPSDLSIKTMLSLTIPVTAKSDGLDSYEVEVEGETQHVLDTLRQGVLE